MPDCTDICEEYQMCADTVSASMMMTETELNNDATVAMLFALETNPFMTEDQFKQDLLDDMAWDIEEGNTSFTPLTIDDIPGCTVNTAIPMGCEAEVQPKLDAIEESRMNEATARNFQLYLMAYPCDQIGALFE